MKIRIEVTGDPLENEIIIRCGRVDDEIRAIHRFILDIASAAPRVSFYKGNEEYYLPLEEVLFFETEGEVVRAHTSSDVYLTRYRLYELENLLPLSFIRVSKSSIVNIQSIYSIKRELSSASLIAFAGTHKHVYVSRRYYASLKERMQRRNTYEE